MITTIAVIIGVGAFALFAVGLRFSRWHTAESEFWYRIAHLVTLDPGEDAHYRPLLEWAKTNRPSPIEMVRGWQPPAERRRRAP